MIKTMRKKLLLLFLCSVMFVVTLLFCILIQNSLSSARKTESDFFERTATQILFQLSDSSDYSSDFILFENAEKIAFLYLDEAGIKQYQTASTYFTDIEGIMSAFKTEMKKESIENLKKAPYSQSGIFTFSYHTTDYYGIYCKITLENGNTETIYLVKKDLNSIDFLRSNLGFYLVIWVLFFFCLLIISRYLIQKAIHPMELAVQSQKEFVTAASHELKSPLSVILTNAEVVASDPSLSEHLQKNMSTIDLECVRMGHLVQDLLLLSSIDSHTWTLHPVSIDVCTLVITLYEKFEPLCKKNGMELNLDLKDDTFPDFTADKNRLEQILSIFLDNAIHYGKSDSSIDLTVYTETKHIVFSIRDHGIGIKEEEKSLIYDRFYQIDKSRTHTQHYGLGLSIAKELVSLHKGKIELLDTPDVGCTFNIYFPI